MRTWNSIVVAALFCLSFAAACETGAPPELYLSEAGLSASEVASEEPAAEPRAPVFLLDVQGTAREAAFLVHIERVTLREVDPSILTVEIVTSPSSLAAKVKNPGGVVLAHATYGIGGATITANDPRQGGAQLPARDCGDPERTAAGSADAGDAATCAMVQPFFLEQLVTFMPWDGVAETRDLCDEICCDCLRTVAARIDVPTVRIDR